MYQTWESELNIITGPLLLIVQHALAIAVGDLARKVDIYRSDELGQLAEDFRKMIAMLRNKAQSADRIASGSRDLDERAGQQASDLEKATGSLDKITSNTRYNAGRCLEEEKPKGKPKRKLPNLPPAIPIT